METGKIVYHAAVILMIYPEDFKTFIQHKYWHSSGNAQAVSHTPICVKIAKSKRSGGAGDIKVMLNLRTGEMLEDEYGGI